MSALVWLEDTFRYVSGGAFLFAFISSIVEGALAPMIPFFLTGFVFGFAALLLAVTLAFTHKEG